MVIYIMGGIDNSLKRAGEAGQAEIGLFRRGCDFKPELYFVYKNTITHPRFCHYPIQYSLDVDTSREG